MRAQVVSRNLGATEMSGNALLIAFIRDAIAARGPVTFAWFMEQALYHPRHGYYTSGRAQIGRKGDYFTNVSVGPLFGRLLAGQFLQIRELLGAPNEFTVVEEGAHSGDFARDVLEAAPGLRYVALERSRGTTLSNIAPFCGVHFSNELIDSFPVHLVKWTGAEWLERHVGLTSAGKFEFIDLPLSSAGLAERTAQIPLPLPAGYETEVNLEALRWIETLAEKLIRGFVIAVDYGLARDEFYAPERTTGTLQSYAQHRVVPDPLAHLGDADLTAHVEWTSLAERARECGFEIAGFTDQHHFITGLLSDEIAADAKSARALQTLLHPGFLGMKFQFLVLAKNVGTPSEQLAGLRFAWDINSSLGLQPHVSHRAP